jgi:hypothetical protein
MHHMQLRSMHGMTDEMIHELVPVSYTSLFRNINYKLLIVIRFLTMMLLYVL